MNNWKLKIDQLLQQQQEEESRRAQELAERERQARTEMLKSEFQCHVCGIPSSRPGRRRDPESPEDYDRYFDDWSVPGDLVLCSVCQQWTCGNCLYTKQGYTNACRSCIDEGHLPRKVW